MKKLSQLLSIILSLYFSAALYLYYFQSDFLYFPTAKTTHLFKQENFSINETTVNVIVLNPNKLNAILYFGGNSESVAKTAKNFKNLFSQHTIYFVNYRGYGASTGQPAEQDLYADAQYIYDNIASRHKLISVVARSLGTGIATLLASTRSLHKMVLITPYDSIQNVAKEHYPLFPIELLINEKYDSASRVKDIKESTLIILAELDALIPFERSQQLIKKFPASQITVETINNANHRNLSHQLRYYTLIKDFL